MKMKNMMKQHSRFAVLALLVAALAAITACTSPNSEIDPNLLYPAPELPSLVPGNHQLEVRFTAVVTATSYEIWYGETEVLTAARLLPGSVTTTSKLVNAFITGLENGVTYYVWSRAFYSDGISEYSEYSSAIPIPPPEHPPTNIVVSPEDTTILSITWTATDDADSYMVYYTSTGMAAPDSTVSVFEASGTSAFITELQNRVYYVWITSKNTAGESDFSNRLSGTPAAPTSRPAAPLKPTLVSGDARITASWSMVKQAKSYILYYSTTNNITDANQYPDEIDRAVGTLSGRISGLINNSTYYVWVRAKNDAGLSDLSPSATVTIFAKRPVNFDDPYLKVGVAGARFPNEEGGKGDRLSRKQETGLGDLVGDSMVWWGRAHYDGVIDFAFYNGGLITNALPAGDILVGGIRSILWEDPISLITLRGAKVIELFEYVATIRHNGGGGGGTGAWGQVSKEVRYTINYTYGGDPTTGNLEDLTIRGEPVDPNRDYRFITSTYLVDGGDGYGAYLLSDRRLDTGVGIPRAVVEYIYDQDNVPIVPTTDGRITLIGAVWSTTN
jgi:hypothetical protein